MMGLPPAAPPGGVYPPGSATTSLTDKLKPAAVAKAMISRFMFGSSKIGEDVAPPLRVKLIGENGTGIRIFLQEKPEYLSVRV
jgi:hypothetical protein